MISASDEQIVKKICVTFNSNFLRGTDMIQSVILAIDMNKMAHPGLSRADAKEVLSVFSGQMKVHAPSHLRELTINIFDYLMINYVNSSIKSTELHPLLDKHLAPLKLW